MILNNNLSFSPNFTTYDKKDFTNVRLYNFYLYNKLYVTKITGQLKGKVNDE